MSETPESYKESQPKPKGINLDTLLPAKASVKTSIGPLYVRHAYTTDWKNFEIDDADKLGRAAVRQLSNRAEDKHDSTPLAEEDLNALNDADYCLLAPVISKQNGWDAMIAGDGLKELGEAIKAAKMKETERHKKMLKDINKSIDSSYGFPGKSALESLQGQMTGFADLRSPLSGTSTKMLEDIHKSIDSSYGFLGKSVLERLQGQMAGLAELRSSLSSGTSAIEPTIRDINLMDITSSIESPRVIEAPRIPSIPGPEETPLGRAALESAKNSREVAQKMDALVDVVAGLNQTMVQDVLPAWFNKIGEDQKGAEEAFKQAAKSLMWTKWAVIASVAVTVLTTWLQVEVAINIDRGNTEQQKQSEAILREQLTAQQKLIEQQTLDAAAIREAISVLKTPADIALPKN